jgi:adenylate cyclase
MSDDPEQEYFADGIAEDILTSLQAFRKFPVIARNSTFNYKGTSPDVREVARELGAGYVLEGSVRKVGDRVRITGQLIDASGHHLWAGKYDKELSDIFTVQDEITAEIVGAIAPEIERTDVTQAARKRSKDMTAWDYLLQAQDHYHKLTPEGIRQCRELTEKVIERDEEFALAYVFLARAHISNSVFFNGNALTECAEESLVKAEELARKAVSMDKSLAFARAISGLCFYFRRQTGPWRKWTKPCASTPANPSYGRTMLWHCGLLVNRRRRWPSCRLPGDSVRTTATCGLSFTPRP